MQGVKHPGTTAEETSQFSWCYNYTDACSALGLGNLLLLLNGKWNPIAQFHQIRDGMI